MKDIKNLIRTITEAAKINFAGHQFVAGGAQ